MGPLLAALIPLFSPLVDAVVGAIPNENERATKKAELELKMMEAVNQVNLAQIDLNKVEAANSSVFVAGWRPAIGWVCAASLAWTWIIAPLLAWVVGFWHPGIALPVIPVDQQLELVFAMLGLGGLRTFEKLKGVASSGK